VGKYHTEAFDTLKDKYEKNSIKGRPSELSPVLDDMKEILLGYCSLAKERIIDSSCFQMVDAYVNKGEDYYNGLDHESTEVLLKQSEDALKYHETKEDTLNKIASLRNQIIAKSSS